MLIPHLGGGGAEQVMALLARGLSCEKYELHLGLLTQADAGAGQFPPWVTVHPLAAARVRTGAFRLLRLVYQVKPKLILSGMWHQNFLALLLRPFFPYGTRVVVRQNATVSSALDFGDLPGYTRLLYRLLYPHADRVICQTRAMARDLAGELGIPQERLAVLQNPVDVNAIRAAAKSSPCQWNGKDSDARTPHLLAVGRLSREKGFDLLLRSLVTVQQRFPSAELVIAGVGAQEAALKAECRQLGLEAAVRFVGHVPLPSTYYPGASVFVVPSRHEGMPNSMLEAAAGGLPIVALPASEGMVDLLRGQPGAWLAPEISAESLADSLLTALEELRPGERFAHAFIGQFRIERAIRAYEEFIDATISGSSIKQGQA